MQFESILKTKEHNTLYLNRYIKYINLCIFAKNIKKQSENHHICPAAADMFPEFSKFSENKWNSVLLTTRQHIVAHILLQKAFPWSKSCICAVFQMFIKPGRKHKTNDFQTILKLAAYSRGLFGALMTNTVPVIDKETGKSFRIKREDIIVGRHISHTKNKHETDKEWSKIAREASSTRTKGMMTAYNTISLTYSRVKISDIDYATWIPCGKLRSEESRQKTGKAHKNRRHVTNDITGERKFIKQNEEMPEGFRYGLDEENSKRATESMTDSRFYYNDKGESKRFKSGTQPEGYKKGKLYFGKNGNFFSNYSLAYNIFTKEKKNFKTGEFLDRNYVRKNSLNLNFIVYKNTLFTNTIDLYEFLGKKYTRNCIFGYKGGNELSLIKKELGDDISRINIADINENTNISVFQPTSVGFID